MNNLNNDLDDFGTELPDSYTYSPRGHSMPSHDTQPASSSRPASSSSIPHERNIRTQQRQAAPEPVEGRRMRPEMTDEQEYQRTQTRREPEGRREKERKPDPVLKAESNSDKRIKMFIGLLLMIVAILMAVFMISHLKNGAADQSMVMNGGKPEDFSNVGGPIGAQTSYFFVTRWFGLGSIAFLIYFALVGLSLLGIWKTKFWATTFQCLLIGITTSIVLGFVTYTWPTTLSWGGEHGRFVNTYLLEYAGWPGALGLSLLLLGSIVIVYFNQIYAFYKARRAELEARRQRRQAAREEYERQRKAAEAALAKAKSELSEENNSPVINNNQKVSDTQSQEFEAKSKRAKTTYSDPASPIESIVTEKEDKESPAATVSLEELESEEEYLNSDSQEEMTVSVISNVVRDSDIQEEERLEDSETEKAATEDSVNSPKPIPAQYVIGIDEDEDEDDVPLHGVNNSVSSSSLEVAEPEGFEIDDKEPEYLEENKDSMSEEMIMIDEDEDSSTKEAESVSFSQTESAPTDIPPSPADTPISVTVNEIEKVDHQTDLYDPTAELSKYKRPPLDLLADDNGKSGVNIDIEEQEENKQRIIKTLLEYGIPIVKIDATVGPTVTLFEIVPAEGVRIASIRRIEDDIARSLAAEGIRIIAPIPGKGTVGIEVPNHTKRTVTMRSVLSSRQFQESTYNLPVAMGTTVSNEVFIEDLAKMPHLLVAGATGQGKSVGLNAIISSLIYKKHPAELKFVLVDPKMVEFSLYNKLERHFLAKLEGEEDAIITDPEKVKATLNSLCIEMDNRYRLLKDAYVRSLEEYNTKFINRKLNPEHGHKFLPYIVVVVDEFADLIMMAGKEIEMPIARIAQKARAVGIHLIIATQRPSTNVITGMIKANFPARIAFKVSAMVDSKTILDRTGANSLIGKGDMLFSHNSKLERVQCAFISTEEVEAVCDWIDGQIGYEGAYPLPEYTPDGGEGSAGNNFGDRDSLFDEAARFVIASGTASTSALQRRYSIGYNRAGKIMDQMEAAGIVGPANGGKPRPVLVDSLTLERILENN